MAIVVLGGVMAVLMEANHMGGLSILPLGVAWTTVLCLPRKTID